MPFAAIVRPPLRGIAAFYSLAAVLAAAPQAASADVQHVVARGHTVLGIAHRYHVSVKAILEANHLKDPNHLKVGETLTIPGAPATSGANAKLGVAEKGPASYAMRPKTPGVIHATRLATNEDFTVRVARRSRIAPTSLKEFERMLRNGAGLTHPIDPRLIALVGIVSDHFGSRRLEIISGFRPYTPTQYTPHSNHNVGHAVDFRVVGIPNEVLRDYCRTLHDVGVGYYPNSTFVHLDVRTSPAYWIDYSRPGEHPRYDKPDVDADEGTSDVSDDGSGTDSSTEPSAGGTEPLAAPPTATTPASPASPAPTPSAQPPSVSATPAGSVTPPTAPTGSSDTPR